MDGLQQNPDITALHKDISDLKGEVIALKERMKGQKENADGQIRYLEEHMKGQKENADMQIRYLQWALGLLFTVFGIIAVILARVAEVF